MNIVFLGLILVTVMACVAIIAIGVIIVVKISKKPNNQQLLEYNSFKELANELKETNKDMRKELVDLKDKVSSIEKILKEVE